MRIKNWIGAGALASAACLLAACGGMDPSEPGYMSDELGAFQSMTPGAAGDLSQGAACMESVRPGALECPGLSQIEVAAIQASIQPRLMSIAPMLRVSVQRTGGTTLAVIDGGQNSQAFEDLFGTSSLIVPVQADGSFEVTTPVAERGAGAGQRLGGLGVPGMAPGFGLQRGAGLGGQFGLGSPFMGPTGGGPFSGYSGIGGLAGPTGFAGTPMSSLSGPIGASGCPCPGAGIGAAQPMQNAYGVLAHLGGKIDTAGLQFGRDANNTEVAILDRDTALQMQGEILLIPLTPGLEAGGPQGVPGGQQAVPMTPQAGFGQQTFQGAPQGPGALGAYGQQTFQGPQGAPGQQVFQGAPGVPGQQAYAPGGPQAGLPGGEAGVVCRIPLQICGSCGVGTSSQPAIVTTPVVPQMPACPQMVIRPVMQQACPSACP